MKKGVLLILSVLLCLSLTDCAEQKNTIPTNNQISSYNKQSDIQNNSQVSEKQLANPQELKSSSSNTDVPKTGEQRAKLIIGGQKFDIILYDTPAANALYDMLPLTLTFKDFNNIEKIAYMDNELTIEGEPDSCDPDIGDLCLYAPWGNLSIFYKDFRESNGLISLGHIENDIDIIGNLKEDFTVVFDVAE